MAIAKKHPAKGPPRTKVPPLLEATIRNGDLSDDENGDSEFDVAGGEEGQYAWPRTMSAGGGWQTDLVPFQLSCLPGGGTQNISLQLDDGTVPGGNKTYRTITKVVVAVTALPNGLGEINW